MTDSSLCQTLLMLCSAIKSQTANDHDIGAVSFVCSENYAHLVRVRG